MSFAPLPAAAVDSAVATHHIPEDACPHRWRLSTRIAFRFAFCYLGGYCLFNGNATVWQSIPGVGYWIENILSKVLSLPAQYLAEHLFHVPPPGNHLHPTGSGDTAINWISVLILFTVSLLATIVWSALDRRRSHYQTLAAWLRFLIRLTIGIGMVVYGIDKVFPLQMSVPPISSLSQPLGMHSPMAFLWAFVGLNPFYEMVCGGAELLAGLLLLFRRTALAGALFTAFVVSNVLLYNLFFDVPVKLYAGHLLLLALFVVLSDAKPLIRFFWLHQPSAPTGVWVPPATRPWFRRATITVEIAFAVLTLGTTLLYAFSAWHQRYPRHAAPCPLCGDWHIDTANLTDPAGHTVAKPPRTASGHQAIELILDNVNHGALRDSAGDTTPLPLKTNTPAHTLEFDAPGKIAYSVNLPDPTHLTLTPTGDAAKTTATLTLTLVTPPGGYPLTHRGFHWVSEYPYWP